MTFRMAVTSAAIALAVACTSSPSLQDCSSDAECGGGNLCHGGACALNAPPVASFEPPNAVTTNRVVTLLPTVSDPEGRAVETRWSIVATSGGCAFDLKPADGPALSVVFWCPGTYEATLIPIDSLGLEGAPAVRSFEVTAAIGAPSVTADPTVFAVHECDVDAGNCVVLLPTAGPILQLGAVASDPANGPLTFEWISLPPAPAAEDPLLVVAFPSGAEIDRPTVTISNSSMGPIAGVYRFRVRATNPEGLLAQAYQEVVVLNRSPTAAPGQWLVTKTVLGGYHVAEGDIETGATDPDGDAFTLQGSIEPAPRPGCTEEVTPSALPSALHVRIACAAAADLGGEPLRTLTVTITDANGASVTFSAPLPIEDPGPTTP